MGLDDLTGMLESGVAMLGASADADRVPEVFRIWGATYDPDPRVVHVLVSGDAGRTLDVVGEGSPVSCTFTDITTFASVQVKGTALGPGRPPRPPELDVLRRYGPAFGERLRQIGHPAELTDMMRPLTVFVVDVAIEAVFDQTPGPGAGAALTQDRP